MRARSMYIYYTCTLCNSRGTARNGNYFIVYKVEKSMKWEEVNYRIILTDVLTPM